MNGWWGHCDNISEDCSLLSNIREEKVFSHRPGSILLLSVVTMIIRPRQVELHCAESKSQVPLSSSRTLLPKKAASFWNMLYAKRWGGRGAVVWRTSYMQTFDGRTTLALISAPGETEHLAQDCSIGLAQNMYTVGNMCDGRRAWQAE